MRVSLSVACCECFVEVFATELAKVFVRARLLGHNPNTGTMLPDFAKVALHKEACCIVGNIGRKDGIEAGRVLQAEL